MKSPEIVIGITQGDMNGIGYEVILKTLQDREMLELCTPVIYGSSKAVSYYRKALELPESNITRINTPSEANKNTANIINCLPEDIRIEPGKPTPQSGEASATALKRAVEDLQEKKIDALVTAPINKHNIQSPDFQYPGHTEFLKTVFNANEVLMLMVSERMRVGVVTGHVPLAKVPELITIETILQKLQVMNQSLIVDFGIRKPRIAVLGLNPHCGDNGIIGDEEQKIIIPAIEKANDKNILALGPYPADGFFGSDSCYKFDGILAMYHDQGLTPFKSLNYGSGVNYTAGLPVIRTSPAHGTAFELTGTNQADPGSFRHAMFLAIDIYKNRKAHKSFSKNPLKSSENSSSSNE